MDKPRKNFWQLWNMAFGFFGIQFGWNLQLSNMSSIYEYLGAKPDQIPILWLAAPLTGFLVQPLIGRSSDRTWNWLGRRRPYFTTGAILSSLALLAMPNSPGLWMAAGLLWVLDASINISMEPFRAFVADLLPPDQRTTGFAFQSFFIGLGAVFASSLPWMLSHWFGVTTVAAAGSVPQSVKLAFYIGGAVFFTCVMWTVFTTKEYPPDDMAAFQRMKAEKSGIGDAFGEIFEALRDMPDVMRRLAPVQLCTWLGLFCMWLYFGVAVAHNVFGAVDATSPAFTQGVEWGGICFSVYSLVCFIFSLFLPRIAAAIGRRNTHTICLLCGAAGLMSVAVIENKWLLFASMVGVGIAWASTLAMPYALFSGSLPKDKIGVYMGIFNFFIVIPEIIASLGFGWVMSHLLNNNRLAAVVCGGGFMALAALLMRRVREPGDVVPGAAS